MQVSTRWLCALLLDICFTACSLSMLLLFCTLALKATLNHSEFYINTECIISFYSVRIYWYLSTTEYVIFIYLHLFNCTGYRSTVLHSHVYISIIFLYYNILLWILCMCAYVHRECMHHVCVLSSYTCVHLCVLVCI